MFLFETMDNLFLPNMDAELAKLRKFPYDTRSGIEQWRKKADSLLVLIRIMAGILVLMGLFLLLLGVGVILLWQGLYWFHAAKCLRKLVDEAYAIRLKELESQPLPIAV